MVVHNSLFHGPPSPCQIELVNQQEPVAQIQHSDVALNARGLGESAAYVNAIHMSEGLATPHATPMGFNLSCPRQSTSTVNRVAQHPGMSAVVDRVLDLLHQVRPHGHIMQRPFGTSREGHLRGAHGPGWSTRSAIGPEEYSAARPSVFRADADGVACQLVPRQIPEHRQACCGGRGGKLAHPVCELARN